MTIKQPIWWGDNLDGTLMDHRYDRLAVDDSMVAILESL